MKNRELTRQMDDVIRSINGLNLNLNLLMHDKEQFIKDYGSEAYDRFIKLQAMAQAFVEIENAKGVWYK